MKTAIQKDLREKLFDFLFLQFEAKWIDGFQALAFLRHNSWMLAMRILIGMKALRHETPMGSCRVKPAKHRSSIITQINL